MQIAFRQCKDALVETPPFTIPRTNGYLVLRLPTVQEPQRSKIRFRMFKKDHIFQPATVIAEDLCHGSVIPAAAVCGPGRYLGTFKFFDQNGKEFGRLDALA